MFYAKILKQLRVLHHLLLPGNQFLTYCITDISYCLLLLYIVLALRAYMWVKEPI